MYSSSGLLLAGWYMISLMTMGPTSGPPFSLVSEISLSVTISPVALG